MVSPISIGILTGFLLGVSIIFFSTGHKILGTIALTTGVVLAFRKTIKFFKGDN